MIFEYVTLKFIWWLLIILLFSAFAISGGMDLGVASLLPLLGKNDKERITILNSIGPTWEGNQVWLITSVGAIFAAWPLIYATAFSTLYLFIFFILITLILRPPGLDYRNKLSSLKWRYFWDWCLFISGICPSIMFGIIFGNLFLGMPFYYDNNLRAMYHGDFVNLFHPFAILTGIISLSILSMQGLLFLQIKTDQILINRIRIYISIASFLFIISFIIAIYCLIFKIPGLQIINIPDINTNITPIVKQVNIAHGSWLENYQKYPWLLAAPLAAIIGNILAMICSKLYSPGIGILFNSTSIISVIATFSIALFPFILPSSIDINHSLTIWDAVSSYRTLNYMFWVVTIFLPVVLSYTTWSYRVMRGKVNLAGY